jgi:hypothetical protein
LAGVSEPENRAAETWLADVIWIGERRQYLIAAQDEVGAVDQMQMIPHVKGAMDLGLVGELRPGPVEVWRSGDGRRRSSR